jgi:hypothetical protein
MKITKKQIVALDKQEKTVRELFPEVFKTELEVGKWYKKKDFGKLMFCFSGEFSNANRHPNYGFSYDGEFSKIIGCFEKELLDYIPATKEEVETALINEAKRRGFKEGVVIKELLSSNIGSLNSENPKKLETNKLTINNNLQFVYCNNLVIFRNGTWAEIIQPKQMTKDEIENALGYEIEIKLKLNCKDMKYLKRILGLPFFLMLNIIGIIFHLFKISKLFVLYGGEAMAYDKKTTPKMITDIYYQLENTYKK